MKSRISNLLGCLLIIGSLHAQDVPSFSVKVVGNGGLTAVLIPGYSCSGEVWDGLIAKYSNRFTFHVVTFAGFAGERPQQNPQFKKWIVDLAKYIADKKIMPVVIGHSLGGVVAMDLAAHYPLLISKIIVVDALPSLSAFFNPSFQPDNEPDCSPMAKQFVSMDNQQFYAQQKYSMYSLLADTSKIEKVVSWAIKSDRNTLVQIYCQFVNQDLRSSLSSIKCKTLILLEPSFKARGEAINEQFKLLPKAISTIRYANKGLHFLMYDDVEWFLNEVGSFVQ